MGFLDQKQKSRYVDIGNINSYFLKSPLVQPLQIEFLFNAGSIPVLEKQLFRRFYALEGRRCRSHALVNLINQGASKSRRGSREEEFFLNFAPLGGYGMPVRSDCHRQRAFKLGNFKLTLFKLLFDGGSSRSTIK